MPGVRNYFRAIVIKTMYCWCRKRQKTMAENKEPSNRPIYVKQRQFYKSMEEIQDSRLFIWEKQIRTLFPIIRSSKFQFDWSPKHLNNFFLAFRRKYGGNFIIAAKGRNVLKRQKEFIKKKTDKYGYFKVKIVARQKETTNNI